LTRLPAGFHRTRQGIEIRLRGVEAATLSVLFGELAELLADPEVVGDRTTPTDELARLVGVSAQPVDKPTDPALARLFPDAYADESAAREYRRLTQEDLRRGKQETVQEVIADLETLPAEGQLRLDGDQAGRWLAALNDVRLVLGTRYDVGEDLEAELARLSPRDQRRVSLEVYAWLGWLEETLVDSLSPG
jgi:hypothetical protein